MLLGHAVMLHHSKLSMCTDVLEVTGTGASATQTVMLASSAAVKFTINSEHQDFGSTTRYSQACCIPPCLRRGEWLKRGPICLFSTKLHKCMCVTQGLPALEFASTLQDGALLAQPCAVSETNVMLFRLTTATRSATCALHESKVCIGCTCVLQQQLEPVGCSGPGHG